MSPSNRSRDLTTPGVIGTVSEDPRFCIPCGERSLKTRTYCERCGGPLSTSLGTFAPRPIAVLRRAGLLDIPLIDPDPPPVDPGAGYRDSAFVTLPASRASIRTRWMLIAVCILSALIGLVAVIISLGVE